MRIRLIIYFSIGMHFLGAQNLVPNPDFSAINRCDTVVTTMEILFQDWFLAPQQKPSLQGFVHNMHHCQNGGMFDWSRPKFGYVQSFCFTNLFPKAGLGYPVVFLEDDTASFAPLYSTLVQAKLKQALVAQDTYLLSFHAAAHKLNEDYLKSYGMYLSRDTVAKNDIAGIIPQVSTPEWYHDTLWNRFDTTYIAQGGEQFVTLGNFWPCNDAYERDNPHTPLPPSSSCPNVASSNHLLIDAVSVYPLSQTRFTIDLPEDTTVCGGDTLLLDPVIKGGIPDDTSTTYRWSNGTTDSVLRVTQPGTYWVEVTMNGQFSESDTFRVSGIPALPLVQKPDTLLCPGDSVVFTLPQDTFFTATWRDGFPSLTRYLMADTVYPYQLASACDTQQRSLRIIALVCDTLPVDTGGVNPEDSIEFSDYAIVIPDAFTPNGDGLNETWNIPGLPPGSGVRIYNRWGEQLYEARPYRQPWDGTNRKGKRLPTGVYLYRIAIPTPGGGERIKQGTVKVIR